MFKKENLTIPNLLSLCRLVFLPLLYYYANNNMRNAFLIGYLLLSLTDYLDGIIARRFNQTSPIGSFMDSIADIPFYISTAYFICFSLVSYMQFIYKLYPNILRSPNGLLLIIGLSTVALSFIVSLILFKKPVMMHTTIMRFPSFLVFFLIIISHFYDGTYFLSATLIIYIIGFAEEIIIFLKYGLVHPDSKSLYHIAKNLKPHI